MLLFFIPTSSSLLSALRALGETVILTALVPSGSDYPTHKIGSICTTKNGIFDRFIDGTVSEYFQQTSDAKRNPKSPSWQSNQISTLAVCD